MGTRAATFTAKIHTLSDYHFRTRHGILPIPSGIDVANTLKYFSQTLLGVLKDVPSIPVEMMRKKEQDQARMSLFPILDFKGLHRVVVQLVDVVPLIQQGMHVLGQSLLHSIVCLVPFLEHDYIDTLPNLVASTLTIFPESLHQEIIDTLCNHLLPFCITDSESIENRNYATLATPSILMTVFQYSKIQAHHCQILECLMSLKTDIVKDLLCIIAHGTSVARAPAATLLFYYWPALNPTAYDRRGMQGTHVGWKSAPCQRENCLSGDNNDAIRMCLDPAIAIGTGDHPPPLYVCQGCSDQIRQESENCHLVDILLPMQQISLVCENKNCRSNERSATVTCFSLECASYNGNRPTRYCAQCHSIRHNNRRGGDHVVHTPMESPWRSDPELQSYMVEAIISLLKEAQAIADKNYKESADHHIRATLFDVEEQVDSNVLEERRMLSRYGIYLLVGLCAPTEDTPVETLGRLLAMLFQWFDATAYLKDDQAGVLERLKSEYIHVWLMDICKSHFDVFLSCLLPHPPDYARVGGHWDTVISRTGHIKEGFNRLFCLVPYEIINLEVWDYIMAYWMEAIRTEVPEHELAELKMLLSKVLDPEMSPLGFDARDMYKFFAVRFRNSSAPVQEQALQWLQILCELDVVVPLSLVFAMFNDGIRSIRATASAGKSTEGRRPSQLDGERKIVNNDVDEQGGDGRTGVISSGIGGDDLRPASPISSDELTPQQMSEHKSDAELNLSCFVLMLDVLLKQVELQEIDPHQGLEHIVSRETLDLIRDMICSPWVGNHTCEDDECTECIFCEMCITFYQLAQEMIEYISPPLPETSDTSRLPPEQEAGADDGHSRGPHEDVRAEGGGRQSDATGPFTRETEVPPERHEFDPQSAFPLLTATVQTVLDSELQTVAIIPTEEVVKAVAHAVTLSETDVGSAKVSVARATVVDESEQTTTAVADVPAEDDGTFWQTSQGKFKFTLDELPITLQSIHILLKELYRYEDPDVLYHILGCIKVLCFRAECLSRAAREHRGFLIWCQENLLVISLWKHLTVEFLHVAQTCVQILLHCLTLPSGVDTFWKMVEENFHSTDWKTRFAAVEKVTVIARFLDPAIVHRSAPVQTALANSFCYLISSMDDPEPHVAQRASLFLDTIQNSSLRCLCWCLEVQFDTVIVDRPMILQTLHQLYNCLPDHSILNWEFFLNRFDTLFLEAQVSLERSGEIAYPRDLKNTDTGSESFTLKLGRAQEALNQSANQSIKSLTSSLGPKLRYKRAMSAPGGMTCKVADKEKLFSRQSSAPILKRKSSKFGIGHLHHPIVAHFPNHLFPDGHLKDHSTDEQSFLSMFHRLMETEGHDQDTMHLLIFLLMQFLSQPDHAYPTDEKAMAKQQSIVLRHLNLLLGYSAQEKGFVMPPSRMRSSPVFNAFISNLPRVLDRNLKMATIMLPICVPLLLYCPAPLRVSAESPHIGYSLWCLDPRLRLAWLSSVNILLYKYRYNSPPLSKQFLSLARIVVNTLSAHNHRCRGFTSTSLATAPNVQHSREMSMVSTGELCNIQERDTPPYSPRTTIEGVVVTITAPVEGSKVHYQKNRELSVEEPPDSEWKPRKMADFSLPIDIDDTEPELEAIPESPKTESPQAESLQDSVGELEINADEPYAETALVRVEAGLAYAEEDGDGQVMMEPALCVATATAAPAVLVHQPGVEHQMVRQIHQFHRSFDKSPPEDATAVPISDLEVAGAVVRGRRPPMLKTASSTSEDNSEDTFVRQMTVRSNSVFIGKLVTGAGSVEEEEEEEAESYDEDETQITHKPITTTTSLGGVTSRGHKPKLKMAASWDGSGATLPTSQRLEILDASQLAQHTALRREPAIVSQQAGQQPRSPYLFQPIQSHPITTVADKSRPDDRGRRRQPIRVEAKRSPSIERQDSPLPVGPNPPHSPVSPAMPWTIEVHSPIKLEAMMPALPSPERLLSPGTARSSDVARTDVIPGPAMRYQSGFRHPPSPLARQPTFTYGAEDRRAMMSHPRELVHQPASVDSLSFDPKSPLSPPAVGEAGDGSIMNRVWTAIDQLRPAAPKTLPGIDPCTPLTSVVVSSKPFQETPAPFVRPVSSGANLEAIVIDDGTGIKLPSSARLMEPAVAVTTARMSEVASLEDAGSLVIRQPLGGGGAMVIMDPTVTAVARSGPAAARPSPHQRLQFAETKPGSLDSFRLDAPSALPVDRKASLDISGLLGPLPQPHWLGGGGGIGGKQRPLPMQLHSKDTSGSQDDAGSRKLSNPLDIAVSSAAVMQRLHPSYRKNQEFKAGFSPCPSPRPLTKAFDSHLEFIYSGIAKDFDVGGGSSGDGFHDHDPSPFHFLEKHAHRLDHEESRGRFRQRRQRKSSVDPQKLVDLRNSNSRKSRKGDYPPGSGRTQQQQQTSQKQEEVMVDRCPDCGAAPEQYSDEELGLCIVILSTFIHREPTIVASMLPEILHTVARIASSVMYPWETESNIYLPGNARSVARQFLRCVLHQLASSGVFVQIFQSTIDDPEFFRVMVQALTDFNELNPMAPLQLLLESLNERKTLAGTAVVRILDNVAAYMDCLQLETSAAVWANVLPQFDTFFRKLMLILPADVDVTPLLRILCNILRIQGLNSFKAILDPFSKLVSFALQSCKFKYGALLDLCHLCNRAFSKERDKLYMSRTVVFELVQAIKFKTNIPDENLLKLVQFIIQDAGGTLGPSVIVDNIGETSWDLQMINTSASECMRQYFSEALDFVADVHTLSKIKSNFKGTLAGLNEDTLGGTLKAGVAQFLALEITRGNNRENRAINRYLPWLYNPLPSVQQGPKEFVDCVMHIRLLSWLLLGSLIHMVVMGANSSLVCQPIPLEASTHVADHVQVILAGFAEQSKASVLHMSSLFHAFILCQLWTMYCEQLTSLHMPGSDHFHLGSLTLADFWAKVTPGVLQLLSHSKVLAEMVTLHFLSLIEALIECNSTALSKLFPMWRPVLHSYKNQLPAHLVVRLQACENRAPPSQTKDEATSTTTTLLKWIQRLQFKMGQIELQSSAATQFYSV